MVALAACAASAVTPSNDDDGSGDDDSGPGTKTDRGDPGDPHPAPDAGLDTGVRDSGDAGDAGLACIPSTAPSANLVINEVDYDQPGDDSAEFLEIYNRASTSIPLQGLAVVLFNGANSAEYMRYPLTGSLGAQQYLIIGAQGAVDPHGATFIPLDTSVGKSLQNGPNDAIAIIDLRSHRVIDSLVYGGAGLLTAPCMLTEGTPTTVSDSTSAAGSLIRSPNGGDTNNAVADWKFTTNVTPGTANQP